VIDNLSILLSHALLAFAFWQLMNRPELDLEEPPAPDLEPEGFAHQRLAAKRKAKGQSDA
jgi:hypothetical protein